MDCKQNGKRCVHDDVSYLLLSSATLGHNESGVSTLGYVFGVLGMWTVCICSALCWGPAQYGCTECCLVVMDASVPVCDDSNTPAWL